MAFLDATDLLGELLADERFLAPIGTWDEDTIDAARDRMLVRLQERPADEWMAIFRANGNVAAEPFLTTTEALHHPDLVAGGDIVTHRRPGARPGAHDRPDRRADRHPGVDRPPRPHPRPTHRRGARRVARSPNCSVRRSEPGRLTEEFRNPADRAGRWTGSRSSSSRRSSPRRSPRPSSPISGPASSRSRCSTAIPTATWSPVGRRWRRRRRASRRSASTSRPTTAAASPASCAPAPTSSCTTPGPGVPERLGLGRRAAARRQPRPDLGVAHGLQPPQPGGRAVPSTHPCAGAAAGGAGYQGGAGAVHAVRDARRRPRDLPAADAGQRGQPRPELRCRSLAGAITLALLARERFGIGQDVYVNMLAANMYANADDALDYAGQPAAPGRRRRAARHGGRLPAVPGGRRLAVPRRRPRRRVAAGGRRARASGPPDRSPLRDRRRPVGVRRRPRRRARRRARHAPGRRVGSPLRRRGHRRRARRPGVTRRVLGPRRAGARQRLHP